MRITVPVTGLVRPATVDLSDLTASTRLGEAYWAGSDLEIPFDPEPSPAEQKAIRLRLLTRDAAHEDRVVAMATAADNLTTLADVAAAVRLLLANALGEVEGEPVPAPESRR